MKIHFKSTHFKYVKLIGRRIGPLILIMIIVKQVPGTNEMAYYLVATLLFRETSINLFSRSKYPFNILILISVLLFPLLQI